MTIEITSTCIKLNVVSLVCAHSRSVRTTIYHNNVSDRIKEKSDNEILKNSIQKFKS